MAVINLYNLGNAPISTRYPPNGKTPAALQRGRVSVGALVPSISPNSGQGGSVYYSSFGDRAEISAKAVEYWQNHWRSIRPGTEAFPPPVEREGIMPNDAMGAGAIEPQEPCQTCANRKYVDKSDDSSVSFQTPTKLNPSTAAIAVSAHEREHVFNERADAEREDREVVNQSVTLKYSTCPECGKMYVAGGVTRTTTVSKSDEEENTLKNDKMPEGFA